MAATSATPTAVAPSTAAAYLVARVGFRASFSADMILADEVRGHQRLHFPDARFWFACF
jgi:hypothetical protein